MSRRPDVVALVIALLGLVLCALATLPAEGCPHHRAERLGAHLDPSGQGTSTSQRRSP